VVERGPVRGSNKVDRTPIKNFTNVKVEPKEHISREKTNPSFDTIPGCMNYFGHPKKPNGPCEKCKYNWLCEKCTPKGLMEIIFKEKVKCKTN